MIKLLITGDIHYMHANPSARLDSYSEAVGTKLREVSELARRHAVEAVIIPGEIFNSPNVSIPTIIDLIKILKTFSCPVLTIPGSHDEYSHNIKTTYRSPYSLLYALEYTHCLQNSSWIFTDIESSIDGLITGHGFDADTDFDLSQYGMVPGDVGNFTGICQTCPQKDGQLHPFYIHVAHGMLMDEDPGQIPRYTFVSRLTELPEELQPHVLVCGHYHFGLKLQKVGKTLIINPGAISRVKAHVKEMNRPIQVALLSINSPEDYHAEFISLETALPGEKVLSREHIEAEKEANAMMDEFLALLASEGESKFLEVRDIVEDIAARDNIPEAVKQEALERLGRARERVAKTEVAG